MQLHTAGITQRIQIPLQHKIPLQRSHLTTDFCHLLTFSKLFLPFCGHLIQLLIDPFERVKLAQQLFRAFRADTGDARNFTATDAAQSPVVGQQLGRHAKLSVDKGQIEPAFLEVITYADLGCQQLTVTFVSGNNGGLMSGLGHFYRQRRC